MATCTAQMFLSGERCERSATKGTYCAKHSVFLTADQVCAAAETAAQLVPWIAPNSAVTHWDRAEEVVLRASPVPDYLTNNGIPILRYANGSEAIALIDAVLNPPVPRPGFFRCDIDGRSATEHNIIWVPTGTSVVQLRVSNETRGYLDAMTTGLVWW